MTTIVENTPIVGNDPQHMTSLEIAEVTGKNHFDIMRAIRRMEPAWEKVNGCKFALVTYKDLKGELRPCFSLTKTQNLIIINESGLYSQFLVLQLPLAKAFKRLVMAS